ncbi:putative cytochrome P450 [Dactylonectria estremocensis]|uniref:Cytochrome P450 n=1 Tax=Dactylonectria estremocensis TaxID=1079267 RepID=A0A9P9EI17_9HYPO|nr:putative cytochrome P450 [Dactylonectria estremocensis]
MTLLSVLFETVAPLQCLTIVLSLYIAATKVIYPFLLSPVRRVPGPWYARVSKWPLQYATFKKRRTEYVTSILDRYGPIVVIAPDQVHTTDEAAMKTIYDRSSHKTSFYTAMGSWKGVTSTLGFVDYSSASPSRNNLLQCFQNRNLDTLVENIESHIDEMIQQLDSYARTDTIVDGVVTFRLLALDIVTDVLWGETDTLLSKETKEGEELPDFLRRFHAFSTWNATKSFIPAADVLVALFGSKKWKQLRNDCSDMDITAREAMERWKSNKEMRHREKDVLSMLQSMNSAAAPAVPLQDVPAYMVEMLAAGSSTTSHTAAFACWVLTRHPDAQKRLRAELFEAFPDADDFNIKKTLDLPYLDGVIRETMRLYPMIPGPLERYLGKPIRVAGLEIPKGVIASTGAHSQGRLPQVYPEPEVWDPARWMHATERMRTNWIPFGSGCRSCPGANLATTELKYMLGKILRLFEVVTPVGHENDTLELADVFAAGSKTGHCWLKFVRAFETRST